MFYFKFLVYSICIIMFILTKSYSLSAYDMPNILIRQSDISQIQLYNQNIYFVLQRRSNATVFVPYYNSFMENYYSFVGNGTVKNLCLSKSKEILFMVSQDQVGTKLIKWSIKKRQFLNSISLAGRIMQLLSLKIHSSYYLIVAQKNGNISLYKEQNQQLIYKSSFKFEFIGKNYKLASTKDGETLCVVYAHEQISNSSYQIYFFTIDFDGIFYFIAAKNFSSPLSDSLNIDPKISMTWSNFSEVQLNRKQIIFSTQNHNGIYFKARLEKIGSDNDYVLQISEYTQNFGKMYGIVPSLSYENNSYDILADSSISKLSSNGLNTIMQQKQINFLELASTYNYITLGFSSHTAVYIYTVPNELDFLSIIMSYLTGSYAQLILSSILSTPSGRQALNFFQSLFFNIDDFWLFMYHKRKYGYTLASIFDFARISQNDKWKIYGVQHQVNFIQNIQQQLHKYYDYDIWTHKTFLVLQDRSQTLISNTLQFFLLTLPFSIVVFGIFRILYCLTSRFRIGKLFKRYSFAGYLLIIISQGNLQYFSYLCTNQLRMLFFFNVVNKLIIIFTVLFFFFVIFACVGMFMLLKYLYKKKICVILDCEKSNKNFIFWVTYEFGIRNVVLGFVHAILNEEYYYQMGAIILIDSLSIVYIYVLFVDSYTYFAGNWHFLMKMLNYCIRILLYVSLIVEYSMKVQEGDLQDKASLQLIDTFDFIQQKIVLMIILSWVLSFLVEIIPKKIVRPQKKKHKKNKIVDKNDLNITNKSFLKLGQETTVLLTNDNNAKSSTTEIQQLKNQFEIINLQKSQVNRQEQTVIVNNNPVTKVSNYNLNSNKKISKSRPNQIMLNRKRKIKDMAIKSIGKITDEQICQVIKIGQLDEKLDKLMY